MADLTRRGFLRMLGTGAIVAPVAHYTYTGVWPFRKYFVYPSPAIYNTRIDFLDTRYWGRKLGHVIDGERYIWEMNIDQAMAMEAVLPRIRDSIKKQFDSDSVLYNHLRFDEPIPEEMKKGDLLIPWHHDQNQVKTNFLRNPQSTSASLDSALNSLKRLLGVKS